MILDEIYEAILFYRKSGNVCAFPRQLSGADCPKCEMLFPEILEWKEFFNCPCAVLGDDYVKSEMRRLFPRLNQYSRSW